MLFACLRQSAVGGARDLGQTLGGLRFCGLTTQFRRFLVLMEPF
jgi:hypothetical protein